MPKISLKLDYFLGAASLYRSRFSIFFLLIYIWALRVMIAHEIICCLKRPKIGKVQGMNIGNSIVLLICMRDAKKCPTYMRWSVRNKIAVSRSKYYILKYRFSCYSFSKIWNWWWIHFLKNIKTATWKHQSHSSFHQESNEDKIMIFKSRNTTKSLNY